MVPAGRMGADSRNKRVGVDEYCRDRHRKCGALDPSDSLLRLFHPFSGVTSLAFSLNVRSSPHDLRLISSAAVASAFYIAAAVVLYAAALYSWRFSGKDLNGDRLEVI